ncbi:MAG: hypothetical protein RBT72_06450 [Spirochaetia bacterium]|jgi:hypothetical protein|nr:hypothetical protein [Spirochaetales bacterium]MDX9784371.1 hypothetical protein [Spirochaetia bacterium]
MKAYIDMQDSCGACRSNIALVVLAISCAMLLCYLLVSCHHDSSSWYPVGKAEIIAFYELDTGGQELLTATIEVKNTGKSGISSCSISISATTSFRTYKRTFIKTIDIQPGGAVYFDVELFYSSITERLIPEGLAVIGEFYY